MKKADFLVGSLAFHAVLLIVALLLPPPFPSGRGDSDSGLAYVELAPAKDDTKVYPFEIDRLRAPKEPAAHKVPVSKPSRPAPQAHPPLDEGGQAKQGPAPSSAKTSTAVPGTPQGVTKPPETARPAEQKPAQAAPRPSPENESPGVSVTGDAPGARGLRMDKGQVSFKQIEGWPAPPMVRAGVESVGGQDSGISWHAAADSGWIILSPGSGRTPARLKVGVDTSRMSLGYYEGRVKVQPDVPGQKGDELEVSVMVLPRAEADPELPHSSFDQYMSGDCKVCHLPEKLMPSPGFMLTPEFCDLCHSPSGMAQDKLPGRGGHPMLVSAGSKGTKVPTYGTVPSGPGSDRMDTHLKDGRIVCVTCHNVMEKPGDYGRTWEMASSGDRKTYVLYGGGWESMGFMEPRVYVAPKLMKAPRFLKDAKQYLADPGGYSYDEAEGAITFTKPLDKTGVVYVTLTNPYLRVTTEHNALCYDCHLENTHQGLNCFACHQVHGAPNIKCVRGSVRTPDGDVRRVVFRTRKGKGGFADGGGKLNGICEVCHTSTRCHRASGGPNRHKDGKDYSGTDCTRCHTHKNGFGI